MSELAPIVQAQTVQLSAYQYDAGLVSGSQCVPGTGLLTCDLGPSAITDWNSNQADAQQQPKWFHCAFQLERESEGEIPADHHFTSVMT